MLIKMLTPQNYHLVANWIWNCSVFWGRKFGGGLHPRWIFFFLITQILDITEYVNPSPLKLRNIVTDWSINALIMEMKVILQNHDSPPQKKDETF